MVGGRVVYDDQGGYDGALPEDRTDAAAQPFGAVVSDDDGRDRDVGSHSTAAASGSTASRDGCRQSRGLAQSPAARDSLTPANSPRLSPATAPPRYCL